MFSRFADKIPYRHLAQIRRYWLTISFCIGFIVDLILLNKIDSLIDNLILFFNFSIATVSFILLYVASTDRVSHKLGLFLKKYAPILMQYGFGGLLSGMLVFYGRSSDLLASGPFLLIIVGVILGNEFITKRSEKMLYHLALYYIGVFSYVVLIVPVILGRMGDWIFVLSGLIALGIVTTLVRVLYRVIPNFMNASTRSIIFTIGAIYIGFNALYFSNVIPPIPLSLTELKITHHVERLSDGSYRIIEEEQPLWRRFSPASPVLHPSRSSMACYARVYAPTRLMTDVYHRWEYKDDDGVWREHFRLAYPIESSGTLRGYRGYTQISSFGEGTWRCSVETGRGQVLGRYVVEVKNTGERGELVTRIE